MILRLLCYNQIMHIHLPQRIYIQLTQYSKHHLPEEACGVLLGVQHAMTIQIKRFIPLTNIALKREVEFLIDEREWIKLVFNEWACGQQIMGFIHSHPTTPAAPSLADLDTLWHTLPTQWIISFADMNNPILKAFSFHTDGTFKHLNWSING